MFQCLARIGLDQPAGRDQMAGHVVGGLLVQRTQLAAHRGIQQPRLRVGRNSRLGGLARPIRSGGPVALSR
jgi:hypothetical protein